jgi:DNA repair exonuclease SbcCD ATPase subunit
MLTFKSVTLHNFGSYENTTLDLQNKGYCLVTGKNNFSKDNALSNGSGKSFIWNALCFALTGETLAGIKSNLKNILIEDNTCFVEVDFTFGRDDYLVTRYVAPKSDLKILKNGIDVSGKGLRESEKKFAELLPDLTKDLIASTILIGQGMPNKFSSFTPSGRKEILEKFTQSDYIIENIKERVSRRLEVNKAAQKQLEDAILVNNTQLKLLEASYTQHYSEYHNFIAPDYDKLISEYEEKKRAAEATLLAFKNEKLQITSEIDNANNILINLIEAKSKESKHELDLYNTNNNENIQQINETNTKITFLQNEIRKLKNVSDTCPTCGQKLPNVKLIDTSDKEAELETLKELLQKQQKTKAKVDEKHAYYVSEINSYFDNDIANCRIKLADLKKQLATTDSNINTYADAVSKFTQDINQWSYDRDNNEQVFKKLGETLKSEEESIANLRESVTTISAERDAIAEHVKTVKEIESRVKKGFRSFLLTGTITRLNKQAKKYCEIVFETRDLEIYLDGNALEISYCGKMFDSLSGGEKQRVDLILQFALRHILTESNPNFNANIIVLDEITDFLDKKSCAAVMKLLEKELNAIESVFIISHHAETLDLPIDSELHIIKNEQGISEVF